MNQILHLTGKQTLHSLGCLMYPICLYLKLIDGMMKADSTTWNLPVISLLKYNLGGKHQKTKNPWEI